MKFLSLQGLCYFKDKIINYIEKNIVWIVKFDDMKNVIIGEHNMSNGYCSYIEGIDNIASGHYSHVEGVDNIASGHYSHVEGVDNKAYGYYSHVEGADNIASGHCQHVQGTYNFPLTNRGAFIHGCGVSPENRKNAFLIIDDKVYILGINGFDGTNPTDTNDIATYLNSLK